MITNTCLLSNDEIFKAGLAHVLRSRGFNITESFSNCSEMEILEANSQFLAIVDLPGKEEQAEAVRTIKSLHPSSCVVVLAEEFTFEAMVRCFGLGAHGYLLRSQKLPAMIAALRLIALGEKVMPSNVAQELVSSSLAWSRNEAASKAIANADLTERQHAVLSCLVEGAPNKVIARKLGLCEATVKVHVKAILRKLHARNRTEAALWASANGLEGLPRSG